MRLLLTLLLCFSLLSVSSSNVSASDSEKYLLSNWGQASQSLYKGLPIDWWATYFLKEFDKTAPSPGSNWTSGFSKNDTKAGQLMNWLVDATDKGWIVRGLPKQAWPGAIAVKIKDQSAQLYFVKEVYPWGIVASQINQEGAPTTIRLTYEQLSDSISGYTFRGYIWPVKLDDYVANKTKYENKIIESLNSEYKGYKDSWWGTWMLREFDHYAPAPGVNWRGAMTDWVANAEKTGWQISRNHQDAKIGALLVRGDKEKDRAWGGIVRQIKTDTLTYEDRSGLHTIPIADLPAQNFIGYIFPERQ